MDAFGLSSKDARLVEPDPSGAVRRYAALSYCWGKSVYIGYWTTEETIERHNTLINYNSMPRTIRDAMDIARRLFIRYLWVDALCIIQRSRDDWLSESENMGSIYGSAYLKIAADLSPDSNSGCFNGKSSNSIGRTSDQEVIEITSTLGNGELSRLFLRNSQVADDFKLTFSLVSSVEVDRGDLSRRGWAYQERLLSSRILHYTSNQLSWECRRSYCAEDNFRTWGDHTYPIPQMASEFYGTDDNGVTYGYKDLVESWYVA